MVQRDQCGWSAQDISTGCGQGGQSAGWHTRVRTLPEAGKDPPRGLKGMERGAHTGLGAAPAPPKRLEYPSPCSSGYSGRFCHSVGDNYPYKEHSSEPTQEIVKARPVRIRLSASNLAVPQDKA